jgi:hypothetical protein
MGSAGRTLDRSLPIRSIAAKMVEQVRMEDSPAVFKLTKEMLNAIDAFGRAECRLS